MPYFIDRPVFKIIKIAKYMPILYQYCFMNKQNSKEGNSTKNREVVTIQSKHSDTVSHCFTFNQQKGLITIGIEGQLNLYLRNSEGNYQHRSTNKIFYTPVIAYDLLEQNHSNRLLLVSFDSRVAACKIYNEEIVVYHYFKVEQKQGIVSCVWGNLQNEVILGGQKGHLFIVDIVTNSKLRECNFEQAPLKLLRFRRNEVYLLTKGEISKLLFEKQIKSIVIFNESLIGSAKIIDFAISQQNFYNSLVVLTERRIYFLQMEQLKMAPKSLELKNKVKGGRLGWGKDYSEIGIYETSKKAASVEIYSKNINGFWQLADY